MFIYLAFFILSNLIKMEAKTETSFRDRPINIDDSGKRRWIYAKQPQGKWYKRRTIFSWLVLTFLVVAPLIKVNGNHFMLIDIANRKFSLFGMTVWAQDTYMMAIVMVTVAVSVVLFTVVFGRLWCGWACPQTVFLEFVFRRIEYLFDGNYRKGVKKQEATTANWIKKIAKHFTFFITAILITNVMLMWFVGPEYLMKLLREPILDHLSGFIAMMIVSSFYYWIYSSFREQVCTMICPYGRLQGVLLDSKSISVIYDYKRGEPRGAKNSGDCIACQACVSVCPTGIDIKNGSQLECTNCTACIDECNQVMDRIKKPRNLIRYDSVQGVETGKRQIFNARTYAYSAVLLILFVVLIVAVSIRTPLEASLLRVPGTMYQQLDAHTVSNLYNLNLINKTNKRKKLDIRLIEPKKGEVQIAGKEAIIEGDAAFNSIVIIKLDRKQLSGKNTTIELGVFENGTLLKATSTNFMGPN